MTDFLKKLSNGDVRNWLAFLIVIGCFSILFTLLFRVAPKENQDLINFILGFVFGGAFAAVIGFYFGQSKQVTDKKD